MKDITKIIIVDDHELYRKGMMNALEQFSNIQVVGEASNGSECLKLLKQKHVDIILMDIQMPEMNGLDAARETLLIYPNMKIIAMTAFSNDEFIEDMFNIGVSGFILKNIDVSDLKYAIKTVIEGKEYYSPEVMSYFTRNKLNAKTSKRVTSREKEILQLVAMGFTNQQIADKLYVSKRTITNHRANMHKKLGVSNTIQLLSWAIKNNIIKDI
jgi:DNA-binding NarL/FixJ family response regulator